MPAGDDNLKCRRCGALLAQDGWCPRCLLRAGVAVSAGAACGEEISPGLRVLEKIGEGGVGEVFLAEQTAPVRREVALKRLKPALDAAEWSRRFEWEREALAQLDHPNIAKIFDAGVDRAGRPFYVMELVDGPALTEFCARRKLDASARLRLFAMVCAAVQHAHQKGVLHGDLKPSNILVAVDEAGGPVPKLIDFGVVRAAGRLRFGTPGYASPEQHGGARPPDARSDVFALGMVLRELMKGGKESHSREAAWIIQRATAEVPEERYESAAALAADVRNLLACRPLDAAPGAWTYRAKKFLQRERRTLALAAAVLLVLAGGLTLLARQHWRAREAEAVARATRAAAAQDVLRTQVTERLALGAEKQGFGHYDQAEEHFREARELAAQLGPGDEARRREVERALARLFLTTRQHDRAEKVLKNLLALPPLNPPGPEFWESRFDLTRLHLVTRRFEDADASARETMRLAEARFPRRHPLFLKALHLAGRAHTELRRYRLAHEAFVEVVAGFREHYGPDAPETREAQANLAEVEQVLRNMELLPRP